MAKSPTAAALPGEEEDDRAVKIIGMWASPYMLRPMIALNLKGVEYESLPESNLQQKSELLLKSNPVYKRVPVLLHGAGEPVCESLIIVQYIDDFWSSNHGSSILPRDSYQRALHRFWAHYVDDKLCSSLVAITVRRAESEEAKRGGIEEVFHGLKLLEEVFEKCSNGGGFFAGEKMGYLDIALGSCLGWIRVSEKVLGLEFLDEEKTPLLVGWAERFCAHDAVKEIMPEIGKLVEYRNSLLQRDPLASPSKKN